LKDADKGANLSCTENTNVLGRGSLSPLKTHEGLSHQSSAFNFSDDLLQQQEEKQQTKEKSANNAALPLANLLSFSFSEQI